MDTELWAEMATLESRLESMIRGFGWPATVRPRPTLLTGRPFAPATDVFARNGDLVVRMDLPGVEAKDVDVTAEEGRLVVHGQRKEHEEVKDKEFYRSETFEGEFERYVPLPRGADPSKITAEHRNGVLEVLVPGAYKEIAAPKARHVPVKAAPPQAVKV